jgi:hypothetical protein
MQIKLSRESLADPDGAMLPCSFRKLSSCNKLPRSLGRSPTNQPPDPLGRPDPRCACAVDVNHSNNGRKAGGEAASWISTVCCRSTRARENRLEKRPPAFPDNIKMSIGQQRTLYCRPARRTGRRHHERAGLHPHGRPASPAALHHHPRTARSLRQFFYVLFAAEEFPFTLFGLQ